MLHVHGIILTLGIGDDGRKYESSGSNEGDEGGGKVVVVRWCSGGKPGNHKGAYAT